MISDCGGSANGPLFEPAFPTGGSTKDDEEEEEEEDACRDGEPPSKRDLASVDAAAGGAPSAEKMALSVTTSAVSSTSMAAGSA